MRRWRQLNSSANSKIWRFGNAPNGEARTSINNCVDAGSSRDRARVTPAHLHFGDGQERLGSAELILERAADVAVAQRGVARRREAQAFPVLEGMVVGEEIVCAPLEHDVDPYLAWARAVVDDAFDGPWQRRWSVGCAFLRGMGRGRVTAVTGVKDTHDAVGKWVVETKLPTVGAPKSDSYEGDGYAIVRDERTDVVEKVLTAIIEGVRVHYA